MRGDVRHDQVHEGDVLHLKLNCKSERRTALATSEKSRIDFSEMFEFSGAPVCVLLVLHEVTPLETMDHVSRGCAKHRCMLSGRASKKKKKSEDCPSVVRTDGCRSRHGGVLRTAEQRSAWGTTLSGNQEDGAYMPT